VRNASEAAVRNASETAVRNARTPDVPKAPLDLRGRNFFFRSLTLLLFSTACLRSVEKLRMY